MSGTGEAMEAGNTVGVTVAGAGRRRMLLPKGSKFKVDGNALNS